MKVINTLPRRICAVSRTHPFLPIDRPVVVCLPCHKVLRKAEVEKRRQVEHTLTERLIMATMQHHFVLALRVAFQSHDRLFMLTDYCPGGEVFFHLKKVRR
jgi:hypothetical protein